MDKSWIISAKSIRLATTVENGKPEPDVYLYACEQIGEKPKDCIAVEDSQNLIMKRSGRDANSS